MRRQLGFSSIATASYCRGSRSVRGLSLALIKAVPKISFRTTQAYPLAKFKLPLAPRISASPTDLDQVVPTRGKPN
jgi:hypothetical protein